MACSVRMPISHFPSVQGSRYMLMMTLHAWPRISAGLVCRAVLCLWEGDRPAWNQRWPLSVWNLCRQTVHMTVTNRKLEKAREKNENTGKGDGEKKENSSHLCICGRHAAMHLLSAYLCLNPMLLGNSWSPLSQASKFQHHTSATW